MAIPTTTPIRIRYVARGADPIELGTGKIDMMGIITMTAPAPGQADYLAETLGELNARDYVILKGPPLHTRSATAPEDDEAEGPGAGSAEDGEEPAEPEDPKDNPTPTPLASARPGPSKQKVRRGSSGFLAALKDYGQRVYGLDLDFDERAFVFDPFAGLDDAISPHQPTRPVSR